MLSYMAETLQQTQTLSLRISEVLRKRLEEIRKLTALRKGENVSTSEIAKQLLEGSGEERLEVVDLLAAPAESLAKIRRKGQAGQMLSRAEWTVVAYFAQQGAEGFYKNPLSRETFIEMLKAFEAVHALRKKPSGQNPSTVRMNYFKTSEADTLALDAWIKRLKDASDRRQAPYYGVTRQNCATFSIAGLIQGNAIENRNISIIPNRLFDLLSLISTENYSNGQRTPKEKVTSKICYLDENGKQVCQ